MEASGKKDGTGEMIGPDPNTLPATIPEKEVFGATQKTCYPSAYQQDRGDDRLYYNILAYKPSIRYSDYPLSTAPTMAILIEQC
jgi:hypothetical protein